MDATALLASFDAIAEAPGGVAKLRAAILDLAVRGRLVPQMPGEETGDREWLRCRFDQVARIESDLVDPSRYRSLPHIAPDRIEKSTGRLLPFRTVGEDGVTSGNHRFWKGQILYSKIRPNLNKVAIAPVDGLCSADMYPIRATGIDTRYLHLYMRSDAFLAQVTSGDNRLAMPKVNQTQLAGVAVPLPPRAEQHRIVAKVDELMALCDRLERCREQREAGRERARTAALDALSNAATDDDLQAAWARVRDHFDDLVGSGSDVASLRQAILQLAVRGRLVPHEAAEGHANAFLGLRSCRSLNDDEPFALPDRWAWTTLGRLGHLVGGGTPSKGNARFWGGGIPWVSPKDMKSDEINDSIDHVTEEALAESAIHRIEPGAVLMVVRGMILARTFPAALARATVTINQDMKALIPFRDDISPFLLLLVKGATARVLALVQRSTHGTCKLPFGKLAGLPVAVPPLAEQHRIVGKVQALMAVCDRLEAAVLRRRQAAEELASSLAVTALRLEGDACASAESPAGSIHVAP
ncbi:MAG: restriction endonuclease subunit S [Deltaproteobacteria bacterium]|nr:restriction endonuclease subunit S [Deltaproteobacteria bacterium]